MLRKILLVALLASVCGVNASITGADSSEERSFMELMSQAKDYIQEKRDSGYSHGIWAVAALSAVWQAIVARRDVKLEEANRGLIEDVEKQSDSFLRMVVLKKFMHNLYRGLTLRSRTIGEESAVSGNKINMLSSWAFLLSVMERVHHQISK